MPFTVTERSQLEKCGNTANGNTWIDVEGKKLVVHKNNRPRSPLCCGEDQRIACCDRVANWLQDGAEGLRSPLTYQQRTAVIWIRAQAECWEHERLKSVADKVLFSHRDLRKLESEQWANQEIQKLRDELDAYKTAVNERYTVQTFPQQRSYTLDSSIAKRYPSSVVETFEKWKRGEIEEAYLSKVNQWRLWDLSIEMEEHELRLKIEEPLTKSVNVWNDYQDRAQDMKMIALNPDGPLFASVVQKLAMGCYRLADACYLEGLPKSMIKAVLSHDKLALQELTTWRMILKLAGSLLPFETDEVANMVRFAQLSDGAWKSVSSTQLFKNWVSEAEIERINKAREEGIESPLRGSLSSFRSANGWRIMAWLDDRREPDFYQISIPDYGLEVEIHRFEYSEQNTEYLVRLSKESTGASTGYYLWDPKIPTQRFSTSFGTLTLSDRWKTGLQIDLTDIPSEEGQKSADLRDKLLQATIFKEKNHWTYKGLVDFFSVRFEDLRTGGIPTWPENDLFNASHQSIMRAADAMRRELRKFDRKWEHPLELVHLGLQK